MFTRNKKLFIIQDGHDWADASCEHYFLNCDKTAFELEKLYEEDSESELSFSKWLSENNYIEKIPDDEYEETWEVYRRSKREREEWDALLAKPESERTLQERMLVLWNKQLEKMNPLGMKDK